MGGSTRLLLDEPQIRIAEASRQKWRERTGYRDDRMQEIDAKHPAGAHDFRIGGVSDHERL